MTYGLPKTLEINGIEYAIRPDFREVLEVLEIMADVDLTQEERWYLTLLFFYPDFDMIPYSDCEEAIKRCYWFLNGGKTEEDTGNHPRLMDWQQDFPLIIAPVNRIMGHDIRGDEYVHWWSFLAAYGEIGECTWAQVVHIRDAKARGRPLDKTDQEWYRKNKKLVDLDQKITTQEEEFLKKWGCVNG